MNGMIFDSGIDGEKAKDISKKQWKKIKNAMSFLSSFKSTSNDKEKG
jgi:hypothetical protein